MPHRKQEALDRLILESARDFAIMSLDLNGIVETWTEGAQRLFQYTEEDAVGNRCDLIWREQDLLTAEPEKERQRAIALGMAEDRRWHRAKDGSLRFVNGTMRPLLDEQQRVVGFVKICRDETDRHLAEQTAQQSQQRLRAMVDQAMVGIVTTNLDGRLREVNDRFCQLVGRSREELLGLSFVEWTYPEELQASVENFERLVRDGTPFFLEKRYRRPDGKEVWGESHVSPILDENGKCTEVMSVILDITARKNAQFEHHRLTAEREQLLASERLARAQAERASRLKDEFLATVSHELRTPLTAIVGWSSILQDSPDDAELLREGIEVIQRNAQTQSQLIEDVLDVARITSGKLRLQLRRVDLAELLQTAVATSNALAVAKSVRIVLQAEPGIYLTADPERLQQVVWNLLSNAIKFSEAGAVVHVRGSSPDSAAVIRVTDEGRGMESDLIAHIFDRFTQADSTSTRRQGGLGLGLSIVRHIVELHGGFVEAQSPGPGLGSTFTVTLPRAEAEAAPAQPTADVEVESWDRLAGTRVLVLEDEPDTRRYFSAALGQVGVEVTGLATVADAVGVLSAEHNFDAVFSDIGMPDEDGYSFARRIREMERARGLPALPLVALTAFTREQDRIKAREAGFDLFVPKPVQPAQLLATLSDILAKQSPTARE
jgi:PAS domain S-box-containing protein